MARFTRAISLSFNMPPTAPRVDRVRYLGGSLAKAVASDGSAEVAALVAGRGGRDVFARKKRGLGVGKTKRGKGCKLILMVDGNGIPLSTFTLAANHAEVNTVETLVDVRVCNRMPDHLLYDKAADADWLRTSLKERGTELVTPHRKSRKRPPTQDGRKLRRYRSRWIVERSIAWLHSFRKLIVRQEYHAHLFEGFVQLACLLIILNRF